MFLLMSDKFVQILPVSFVFVSHFPFFSILPYKNKLAHETKHEKFVIKIQYMLPGSNKMWQIYSLNCIIYGQWMTRLLAVNFLFVVLSCCFEEKRNKKTRKNQQREKNEQINRYQYSGVDLLDMGKGQEKNKFWKTFFRQIKF